MKRDRYFKFAVGVAALFLILIFRLIYITVLIRSEIYGLAVEQLTAHIKLIAERGDILDRNGNILATTLNAYRVDADLSVLERNLKATGNDIETYSYEISEILNLDFDDVMKKFNSDNKHIVIQRKIEKNTIDELKEYINNNAIDFLVIGSDEIRQYPNNDYLSHVLGTINSDGNGITGVEQYYNEILKGVDGIKVGEIDKKGSELPYTEPIITEPIDGKDLILTVDERIQYLIEGIAEEFYEMHNADRISIMLSDPGTGEILGLVNLPDYNPNEPFATMNYNDFSNTVNNLMYSESYEPGSIFKIVTIAAALEENVVDTTDRFITPGYIMVNGVRIKNVNSRSYGNQGIGDILRNSCNVGTITIAQRLGGDLFNDYMDKFGFGMKSGIDLPGENPGIIFDRESLTPLNLAVSAIGQAQTVNGAQMLNAMNSIANYGVRNNLHVVKGDKAHTSGFDEQTDSLYNAESKKILSTDTAKIMLDYLYGAVGANKSSGAYDEELGIFGKTGTAQKIVYNTEGNPEYSDSEFIASFIGGMPYDDPKVTILVVVDNPKGSIYGNTVAAPIAKEVLSAIGDYLDIH